MLRAIEYALSDSGVGTNIITQQKCFFALNFEICYSIFLFQIKSLRKPVVFFAWTFLSLLLLIEFVYLYHDATLNYVINGTNVFNYTHGLICSFIVLVYYQICRQFSLRFYGFELGLMGRGSVYIIEENRNATMMDYICCIGIFVIPGISYFF